jgi:hypothetical protein
MIEGIRRKHPSQHGDNLMKPLHQNIVVVNFVIMSKMDSMGFISTQDIQQFNWIIKPN